MRISLIQVKRILLQQGVLFFSLFSFPLSFAPSGPVSSPQNIALASYFSFQAHSYLFPTLPFPTSPSFPTPSPHSLSFHHSEFFVTWSKSNISPLELCTCYLPDAFCHGFTFRAQLRRYFLPGASLIDPLLVSSVPSPRLGSGHMATCAHTEHSLFYNFSCLFDSVPL